MIQSHAAEGHLNDMDEKCFYGESRARRQGQISAGVSLAPDYTRAQQKGYHGAYLGYQNVSRPVSHRVSRPHQGSRVDASAGSLSAFKTRSPQIVDT